MDEQKEKVAQKQDLKETENNKIVSEDKGIESKDNSTSNGGVSPKNASGPSAPGQFNKNKPMSPEDRKKQWAKERYDLWTPKTNLGRMVRDKTITHIDQVLELGIPIREPEIVEVLLPNLEDEVLDVNMVQRMTDSGRRVNFTITAVVGNGNGFVGLGRTRGKEVGPAIRKCIDVAKMNIFKIRRGCGSWECSCGNPHTFPFKVEGKCGSVRVALKPAPQGVSLAVGNVAKTILRMAGVKDAWGFTSGQTQTTVNFAKSVIDALKKTASVRVSPKQEKALSIKTGMVEE